MQAAKDAQRWMGNRAFYDQMLVDACQHHQLKITDEVDVTTMQEYMQACKNIQSVGLVYCLAIVPLRPHVSPHTYSMHQQLMRPHPTLVGKITRGGNLT